MKVLGKNLWKYIGFNVNFSEEKKIEGFPSGNFIIESNEETGLIIIQNYIDYVLNYYEDEEYNVYILHLHNNLMNIYKYRIHKTLILSNEGFTEKEIESELMKLKITKKTLDIINNK